MNLRLTLTISEPQFPFLHCLNLHCLGRPNELPMRSHNLPDQDRSGKDCLALEREKQLPQYFRPHLLRTAEGNSSRAELGLTSPH